MERIRIGKEFQVQWQLRVNGEAVDLNGMEVTVVMVYPSGKRRIMPHIAQSDTLLVSVPRTVQTETGRYRMEVWLNKDSDGQTVADCCNAFCLVRTSCEETNSVAGDNLQTVPVIQLDVLAMQLGVTGKSAYQIWLEQGNEGTESDFVAWIRRPAEDAAKSASEIIKQGEEIIKQLDDVKPPSFDLMGETTEVNI